MGERDLYEALGVPQGAGQKEIEIRFWQWRDRCRGRVAADESCRRAEEAYAVLSDPVRRRGYDRRRGLLEHPAWKGTSRPAARSAFRRAMDLMARGRDREACARLRRAVDLDPRRPVFRSYYGLLLARTGASPAAALHQGRTAVRLDPGDPVCARNLVRICECAGLEKSAAAARRRARQGPGNAAGLPSRGERRPTDGLRRGYWMLK